MSYNTPLLFQKISTQMGRNPSTTLRDLSQELRVSRRTIEKAIKTMTKQDFRGFRQQLLLANVRHLLASDPTISIKEVSFSAGYKSSRSFARAIRRACGFSPSELRSRLAYPALKRAPGRELAIDSYFARASALQLG